jgi:hypothetical protein
MKLISFHKIKLIVLILSMLIVFLNVDNVKAFYNCVDHEGNSIITDNPSPDAICKSPESDKESSDGDDDSAIQKNIMKLNKLEQKSSQGSLTKSEWERQTQLLEELSRYDKENARQRIKKITNNLESKSAMGTLTNLEKEQQQKIIKLQRRLDKLPIKNEIESETNQQQSDVSTQQEKQNEEKSSQKGEIKRLLKIPRLGY